MKFRELLRLVLTSLTLVLVGVIALPAFAQETPYADPTGLFTATLPAGWVDESTAEYGLFTKTGVSVYLVAVPEGDVQAGIDAALNRFAPDLVGGSATAIGEVPAPNGTWTQAMYILPSGRMTVASAQSVGDSTVVLLAVAESTAAFTAISADAVAINASLSIEGVSGVETDSVTTEVVPPAAPVVEGVVEFPQLTGEYAVGRLDYLWTDEGREEIYTDVEGDARVLQVWIWYPAEIAADSAPAPYVKESMDSLFQVYTGMTSENVHNHAYAAASVFPSDSGYPVLVYSPGNGSNAILSASLIEEVASHGYVIVGIDHTYNALLTTRPDGQVTPRAESGQEEGDADFANRLADVTFVLDQLESLNASDPILTGSLDLTRIGLWGHSFGAKTTAEVCHLDDRCQAVFMSDVPLRGESAEVGVGKPIMVMNAEIISGAQLISEVETLSGETFPEGQVAFLTELFDQTNIDRDKTSALLLSLSHDAYRLDVAGTRHNSFTDVPLLSIIDPGLLVQIGGDASIDPVRNQHLITDYVLAFFDTYLKGQPSPLLDGASADYPEVTFSRGED